MFSWFINIASVLFLKRIESNDLLFFRRLYWSDWNRDSPKIEMSNMDGTDRTLLVKDGLELPNGLTYDPRAKQLCWADAGWTSEHVVWSLWLSRLYESGFVNCCCRRTQGGVYQPVHSSEEDGGGGYKLPLFRRVLWKKPLLHGLEKVSIRKHVCLNDLLIR